MIKDVVWSSLVASLQSGNCVLVLGPDIVADPRRVELQATLGSKSVRDAFSEYLARQLKDENQKIAEPVLFAVAQQYEDLPIFATVSLKNIAAAFFREPDFTPGRLHRNLARPFNLILTTCHDNLFAEALSAENKTASRYWYQHRGEPRDNRELDVHLSPDTPAVYHLFGTLTSLILLC
jgi:hypothetical protein